MGEVSKYYCKFDLTNILSAQISESFLFDPKTIIRNLIFFWLFNLRVHSPNIPGESVTDCVANAKRSRHLVRALVLPAVYYKWMAIPKVFCGWASVVARMKIRWQHNLRKFGFLLLNSIILVRFLSGRWRALLIGVTEISVQFLNFANFNHKAIQMKVAKLHTINNNDGSSALYVWIAQFYMTRFFAVNIEVDL